MGDDHFHNFIRERERAGWFVRLAEEESTSMNLTRSVLVVYADPKGEKGLVHRPPGERCKP